MDEQNDRPFLLLTRLESRRLDRPSMNRLSPRSFKPKFFTGAQRLIPQPLFAKLGLLLDRQPTRHRSDVLDRPTSQDRLFQRFKVFNEENVIRGSERRS